MLFVDLAQGFFGSAFQLELHHINIVRGLHDKVNATFRSVVFRLRVESQKFEDNEKHVLIVAFQITCQLSAQSCPHNSSPLCGGLQNSVCLPDIFGSSCVLFLYPCLFTKIAFSLWIRKLSIDLLRFFHLNREKLRKFFRPVW